jgi:hypothetical protein
MTMPTTQRRLAGSAAGKSSETLSPDDPKALEIVNRLGSYKQEAQLNRATGPNARDDKWAENIALYWNRYDFSEKEAWQAREIMPEVPVFVDRFSAALKEALVTSPEGFYTVQAPNDEDEDLGWGIKRMTDLWLSTSGRNYTGQPVGFSAVFEEEIKLGALMAMAATVSWKRDVGHGRVAIEPVDPRNVWYDHTSRELYRVRSTPVDLHELKDMVKRKDRKGRPIFNPDAIDLLISQLELDASQEREKLTGSGENIASDRKPITLDEYLATTLDDEGEVEHQRKLFVVANDKVLIRGPETNPYWHGRDWLVYTPMVPMPLSVYGRSYMEDLGSLAKTFTELTNLILDAVKHSAIKSFVLVPQLLTNPGQVATGNTPGKIWEAEEGVDPKNVLNAIETGSVPQEVFTLWNALKSELREAMNVNEIGLGQFAPKSRTTATEIESTQQSSSAMIRGVAQTIETRFLEPILNLTWKTGIQHVSKDDLVMARAAGPELFQSILAGSNRRELVSMPITFQARGISTLIQRQQMLRSLLSILQVVGQNEILTAAFAQKFPPDRLIDVMLHLSNIDAKMLQATEREMLMKQVVDPMQQAVQAAGGPAGPQDDAVGNEMDDLSKMMGAVGQGGM